MVPHLKEQSPNGFMWNSYYTPPQLTRYIANVGWECGMGLYGRDYYEEWHKMRFYHAKFLSGSRSYSNLEISGYWYTMDRIEDYYSHQFAFGSFPSLSDWTQCDYISQKKEFFMKWIPHMLYVMNENIYMANDAGKLVKVLMNGTNERSTYCQPRKKAKNGVVECYTTFVIDHDDEHFLNIKFDDSVKPEVMFQANGINYSNVIGNNATLELTDENAWQRCCTFKFNMNADELYNFNIDYSGWEDVMKDEEEVKTDKSDIGKTDEGGEGGDESTGGEGGSDNDNTDGDASGLSNGEIAAIVVVVVVVVAAACVGIVVWKLKVENKNQVIQMHKVSDVITKLIIFIVNIF
ncbi:hypothetical protein GPJ56_007403 [Histomonas meleagridis]|uniref:uncharacterized protein n=1 Tax=Histomonas meleagridis TaxID=135588 RepID=UPI00355AAF74|nr:hypothetical protein GPJ56_007403 [Histomonas meleagridis]KAH0804249.1 hypothetical protein GO595_003079 [Histomonas meleagridis]